MRERLPLPTVGNHVNTSMATMGKLRNPDWATINLACRDMRQFEFKTLSRMLLNLHTYEPRPGDSEVSMSDS